MTTIAFDGKTLATDSLVSSSGIVFGLVNKIHKLKDGRHVAFCGDFAPTPELIAWLNGGDKPELGDNESVGGIVVGPLGAFEISASLRLFPACIPWAGGSGEVIAMTAMRCGKTAAQAVEIACTTDLTSRLPVHKVKIC
jgi:hypothetical protein